MSGAGGAEGAECPPFPVVPPGAGGGAELVHVQAEGGSRRPRSLNIWIE